jgi:hypothetical protein
MNGRKMRLPIQPLDDLTPVFSVATADDPGALTPALRGMFGDAGEGFLDEVCGDLDASGPTQYGLAHPIPSRYRASAGVLL